MPEPTTVTWVKGGTVKVICETRGQQSWTKLVEGRGVLSLKEISLLLGVSNTAVWKWVKGGTLDARWDERGKKYAVTVNEVRRYARENGLFVAAGN